jgi:hypothetical protein
MDVNLTPEGFEPGDERGFRDVAALRTDGQGPAGGPQGEPLQYQDQAPVPAEPVQRHLHFRRAGPERAVAVSTNAIKTVDHRGGLDAFLIKAKAADLSPKALELKRAIEKKTPKVAFVKKAS